MPRTPTEHENLRTDERDPTYGHDMTNTENHWPPIPDHAVEIDGRPMLPERLAYPDGQRPYVRCYLHGLIPADHRCANSPGDHYCGTAAHPNQEDGGEHDDQACSHRDWSSIQSDKIQYIAHLHRVGEAPGGGTSGFCAECEWAWPCRTAHMANGWGERYECEDEGWCKHASVPMTGYGDVDADINEALREERDG